MNIRMLLRLWIMKIIKIILCLRVHTHNAQLIWLNTSKCLIM